MKLFNLFLFYWPKKSCSRNSRETKYLQIIVESLGETSEMLTGSWKRI